MAPSILSEWRRRISRRRVSGAGRAIALCATAWTISAVAAPLVYVFGQADFPASNNGMLASGGDFNGDARVDLVAIDYQGNSVALLLGQSDGSFAEIAPSYAVGMQPVAAAVGDFNQDGNLDLAVVDQNCPASDPCPPGVVSILLGNGDGTLQPRVDFNAGPNPVAIAVADFDGDGVPDLAVAAHVSRIDSGHPGLVSILLGKGDGTFAPHSDFPAGTGVVGVIAGELSEAGIVDLVVANHPSVASRTVSFLRGSGDGTFAQPENLTVSGDPIALASGDFNEDGRVDLAVAMGTSMVALLLGRGGGTFEAPVDYATGFGPQNLLSVDLDGDNHLDLLVSVATSIPSNGAISVLLGTGAGTFESHTDYLIGAFGPLVAGDFNADGKVDVAVRNTANTASVILGNGDGTLAHAARMPTRSEPAVALAADLDGDGTLDLAVASGCRCPAGVVSIALGRGDGTFGELSDFPVGNAPGALAVGDFNEDGALDLAVTNADDSTVSILFGAGDGTFLPASDVATLEVPLGVVAADVNGDGHLDLAVTSRAGVVAILLGRGDGTFEPILTFGSGPGAAGIVAADFNGDGNVDLAIANSQTGSLREQGLVSVLLGEGGGTFQPHRDVMVGNQTPLYLAVGDFNGDGQFDLAVTVNRDTFGAVAILFGAGDGSFQMVNNYPTGRLARQLIVDDFDGDGIADVAQALLGDNLFTLLKGRVDGTFRTHARYGAGVGPIGLTSGRFSTDEQPEIIVVNLGSADASVFSRLP